MYFNCLIVLLFISSGGFAFSYLYMLFEEIIYDTFLCSTIAFFSFMSFTGKRKR